MCYSCTSVRRWAKSEHIWKIMERNLNPLAGRVTCLKVVTEIQQSASSLAYFSGTWKYKPQPLPRFKAGWAFSQANSLSSRKQEGQKLGKKNITVSDCKHQFLWSTHTEPHTCTYNFSYYYSFFSYMYFSGNCIFTGNCVFTVLWYFQGVFLKLHFNSCLISHFSFTWGAFL